ncbi:pheromone a factor receptor [Geosmithia morbida]|uniref:Pheromone a factor receptor n=1 Tax=Geosmithia morbida TaxID=1094350 RepID=A0A9P5D2Y1_9HYPO|nr:pheromone a factor receptor [Geosmithia morbida]KAF4121250.1 pheromone a factor receptor [Geosmithia morbida]
MDQSDARGESLIFKVAVPSVDPPYTNPALTANLVFRVALGIMANVVCLVPLRLLHRGGELAAVVFIVNMELKNIETVVFALIWRNDDMDSWWAGYGVCDVHPYFNNFVMTLYGTCLLAIMRNLSRQVGLMRAQGLTRGEKRRRNLVQALIMFPLPILQVALTWFLTDGRYAIGTLVGCTWIPGASWIYLTSIGNDATLSRNRLVNHRAQRARRRLYQTIVSILAPYFPIVLAIGIINIMDTGTMTAYDYQAMHDRQIPFPWSTILYFPSAAIGFGSMNIAYISILTSIPVFIFFGMTKEALNSYRSVLVRCGLGVCFPTLYREYDPDRSLRYAGFSGNSNSSNSHASNSLSTVTQQRQR